MATYGTEITLRYFMKSKDFTTTHSHALKHGAKAEVHTDVDSIISWSIPPHVDDSIGSQGTLEFTIGSESHTYSFKITFVCNNKLQNSVTMTYPEAHFDVKFDPSPEVIKTQAPLNVVITLTQK